MATTRKPLDANGLLEQIALTKQNLRSRGILPVTATVEEGYWVRLVTLIGRRRVSVERLVPFAGRTDQDLLARVLVALKDADTTLVGLFLAYDETCGGR